MDIALHDSTITNFTLQYTDKITFLNTTFLITNKEYIKQFWVGLMDGDGSIQINHWRKKTLQYRLIIKLLSTPSNLVMLNKITEVIGGKVSFTTDKNKKKFIIWKTDNKKTILNIIKIFEKYPPLTSRLICQLEFLKKCLINKDIDNYFIERDKKYDHRKKTILEFSSLFSKNCFPIYYPAWLSGFIEAEGCFCIRTTGSPSFSIGQKDELYLIESIANYFNHKNKIYIKKDNFYLLEIYRKSILLEIIEHCNKNPLLGEKKDSFQIFIKTIKND